MVDWNSSFEAVPANTDSVSAGAGVIRTLKEAIRERLARDHYHDLSGTQSDHGLHNKVTLIEQSSDPSAVTDRGILYTKDVSGVTEVFYRDSSGNVVQLTSGGKIRGGSLSQDGSIVAAMLGSSSVTEAKIQDGAVTTNKIGSGAVTDSKIGTGAVTEAKIGSGAVTNVKIGAGAVTGDKIQDGAVTAAKLGSGLMTVVNTAYYHNGANLNYFTVTHGLISGPWATIGTFVFYKASAISYLYLYTYCKGSSGTMYLRLYYNASIYGNNITVTTSWGAGVAGMNVSSLSTGAAYPVSVQFYASAGSTTTIDLQGIGVYAA